MRVREPNVNLIFYTDDQWSPLHKNRKEGEKVDSGISEMISGVLSNPDALNKIIAMMPAVAQMMNSGGSNNLSGLTNLLNKKKEKIVETTVVNKPDPPNSDNSNISAENLMANENVMNALKNLITALNDASANNNNAGETQEKAEDISNNDENKPNDDDSVMTSANAGNFGNIENIVNMLGSALNSQNNQINQNDDTSNGIEKTLDTLKNFSSVTSPEGDRKSKLLLALKPFLKDERKTKIDTAIKYMNAAKIINLFGKNGFV